MLFVSFAALLINTSLASVECSDKTDYDETYLVYPFELQALPYSEDFLSPFVSEDIVMAHYEHHHQAYVDKLNAFIETSSYYENMTLAELSQVAITDESEPLQKFAGGAYNHYLYWSILTNPDCTKEEPEGPLAFKILESWDTVEDFITEFNSTLGTVFGSGWVWACVNSNEDIEIRKTANQLNPLMDYENICYPFLGADAWEHAYYLDYKWAKQSYYNAFFGAIDWDVVEEFYESYSSDLEAIPF